MSLESPLVVTSKGVYGKLVDDQSRCEHYHSELDVVANKCSACKKYYSCFQCHNACESHEFEQFGEAAPSIVMCGVCGVEYSYDTYSKISECIACHSAFNPRCALHKEFYVKAVPKPEAA